MNVQEKLLAQEQKALLPICTDDRVYLCGVCKRTCLDMKRAKRCCRPVRCQHGLIEPRSYCLECSREKEQRRMEAVPRVSLADYKGEYVFLQDELTLADDLDLKDEDLPLLVWAAREEKLCLDPDRVLEMLTEDTPPQEFDAEYLITGWDDLKAAIEEFNKIQETAPPYVWLENNKLAVELPRPVDAGDSE